MTPQNRNLTQEIRQPSPKAPSAAMCQIKMKLNCCQGLGYQISSDGSFCHAELCSCVAGCLTCHGQGRFFHEGVSRACMSPHPKLVANLINSARVPSRYSLASLSEFSNFSGNGKKIVQWVDQWIKSYRRGVKGMVLEGPVGVGKTYILAAIANEMARRAVAVRFVDFFQLLSELKANYAQNQADDTILKPLLSVDVLIIDELGKGRNSDWELSILDQLVMGRYNQNKTILASTNYSLVPAKKASMGRYDTGDGLGGHSKGFREQLFESSLEERVGERIYSRLAEVCQFISLKGEDYRRAFVQAAMPSEAKVKSRGQSSRT